MVLIHALACDLTLWDQQADVLAARYDVLRYDVRGHGASPASSRPYRFEDLAGDLEGLLDELGIERAHLVGLSMGGVIARLVALRSPRRVASLVLCSTMASPPPNAATIWRERAQRVREGGIAAIEAQTLAHWFPAEAIAQPTPAVRKVRAMLQGTSAEGYIAACAAACELDFLSRQGEIRVPTLVLAGAADPALRALAPQTLAQAISGADLHMFPAAGHFPNLEQPAQFNGLLQRAIYLSGAQ